VDVSGWSPVVVAPIEAVVTARTWPDEPRVVVMVAPLASCVLERELAAGGA
jgi:hypothetical protein